MIVADLKAILRLNADKASFSAGDRLVKRIKQAVTGLVAIKTVKWFADLVDGVYEAADHFRDLAPQIGLSVESLQQLAYAADTADVGVDELTGTIAKFQKNAVAARDGSEEQRKAFKKLGIDYKKFANGAVRTDEVMLQLADTFSKMPDGPEKTALAFTVLGKSGKNLIPVLNEGRAGLVAMGQEAVDLGSVVDDKTAAAMEHFNDKTMKRLKATFQGFIVQLATQLLPILERIATQVVEWAKNNRELIKVRLQQFAEGLGKALTMLGDAFQWVTTHGDEVKTLMIVLGTAFATTQVAAVAAAAATLAAWAPVIAALTAGYAAIMAIKNINDEKTGKVTAKANDYMAQGDADRAWYQRPSDFLGGKLAQADENSWFGRSRLNPFRSGARSTDEGDARRKAAYDAYLKNSREARVKMGAQAGGASTTFSPQITVNGAGDANDTARKVEQVVRDFWDRKMRYAGAAQ